MSEEKKKHASDQVRLSRKKWPKFTLKKSTIKQIAFALLYLFQHFFTRGVFWLFEPYRNAHDQIIIGPFTVEWDLFLFLIGLYLLVFYIFLLVIIDKEVEG